MEVNRGNNLFERYKTKLMFCWHKLITET